MEPSPRSTAPGILIKGVYVKEKTVSKHHIQILLNQPPLTLEEEMAIYYNLFSAKDKNPVLINRLIEAHMPLAVKTARYYAGRGIDFEDLLDITISETVRLAHEYNPGVTHKHRFGTMLPSRLKKSNKTRVREG